MLIESLVKQFGFLNDVENTVMVRMQRILGDEACWFESDLMI